MKKVPLAVASLAVAMTTMVACSDAAIRSGSDGTAAQRELDCDSSGNSAGVRGVTADTVKVGGLVLKTSPTGVSYAGNDVGAKARFERANREGGVGCRLIDYIGSEDDGNDPARNLAAARKLVDQQRVFAVVPAYCTTFTGASHLRRNEVPFIGHAVNPPFCGNRWGLGMAGCYVAPPDGETQTAWEVMVGEALGGAEGRTVAVIAHDSVGGKSGVQPIVQGAKAAGFRVVYSEASLPASSTPSDWTPWVRDLMAADGGEPADVVFSATHTTNNAGLYGR